MTRKIEKIACGLELVGAKVDNVYLDRRSENAQALSFLIMCLT